MSPVYSGVRQGIGTDDLQLVCTIAQGIQHNVYDVALHVVWYRPTLHNGPLLYKTIVVPPAAGMLVMLAGLWWATEKPKQPAQQWQAVSYCFAVALWPCRWCHLDGFCVLCISASLPGIGSQG